MCHARARFSLLPDPPLVHLRADEAPLPAVQGPGGLVAAWNGRALREDPHGGLVFLAWKFKRSRGLILFLGTASLLFAVIEKVCVYKRLTMLLCSILFEKNKH